MTDEYARAIARAADYGEEPAQPLALGWQSKRMERVAKADRGKGAKAKGRRK